MAKESAFKLSKALWIGVLTGAVLALLLILFGQPLLNRFYHTPTGRMLALEDLSRTILREHVYAQPEDDPFAIAYTAYFETEEAPEKSEMRKAFKAEIEASDEAYYTIANLMLSHFDRYSNLSAPELYSKKYPDNENYTGLGISISACGPFIRVASVYSDSAAGRAGIEPGDLICMIGEKDIRLMDYKDANDLLFSAAKEGTTLGILRSGEEALLSFDVTADVVNIPNVSWEIREEIGYLNITLFRGESFQSDVKQAVREFSDAGIRKLVLDLRDNRGGLISDLEYLLNALVPEKDVLLFTEHYRREDDVFKSKGVGTAFDDIVVLVNAETCSSAEVVSGSLKDMGYLLIGQTTYGKAVGLSNWDFHGDKLVLATMTLELPKTGDYNDEGIHPNIFVENERVKAATFLLLPAEEENVTEESAQMQIMALEQRLVLLGYLFSGADGVWDEQTEDALRAFYGASNIAYTGSCSSDMLALLNDLVDAYGKAEYYEDTQLAYALDYLNEKEDMLAA